MAKTKYCTYYHYLDTQKLDITTKSSNQSLYGYTTYTLNILIRKKDIQN